jgi:hypothetical protein
LDFMIIPLKDSVSGHLVTTEYGRTVMNERP